MPRCGEPSGREERPGPRRALVIDGDHDCCPLIAAWLAECAFGVSVRAPTSGVGPGQAFPELGPGIPFIAAALPAKSGDSLLTMNVEDQELNSLLGSIGVILLMLAGLRALQTETGSTFTGNLSWLPYLIVLVVAAALVGYAVTRISRK